MISSYNTNLCTKENNIQPSLAWFSLNRCEKVLAMKEHHPSIMNYEFV